MMPINLSRAVAEISSGPKTCTNPFVKDSFTIPENELEFTAASKDPSSCPALLAITTTLPPAILSEEHETRQPIIKNNPFIPNWIELTTSDLHNSKSKPSASREDSRYDDAPRTNSRSSSPNPIEQCARPVAIKFRSRSRSEAEIELDDVDSVHFASSRKMSQPSHHPDTNASSLTTTNPFKSGHLQKTLSETYLMEQLAMSARNCRSFSQQWQFGKTLSRQCSNQSLAFNGSSSVNGSQTSIVSSGSVPTMTRAVSCESLSSESSVLLADLETPVPQVTGLLCVGLQYDK